MAVGIPWTCDIVSAAVTHTDDLGETFQLRLMLDILNLLTVSERKMLKIGTPLISFHQGVLIFLALVCKKSVFESLRSTFLGKCKYSPGEENTNNKDGRKGKKWSFTASTEL